MSVQPIEPNDISAPSLVDRFLGHEIGHGVDSAPLAEFSRNRIRMGGKSPAAPPECQSADANRTASSKEASWRSSLRIFIKGPIMSMAKAPPSRSPRR